MMWIDALGKGCILMRICLVDAQVVDATLNVSHCNSEVPREPACSCRASRLGFRRNPKRFGI